MHVIVFRRPSPVVIVALPVSGAVQNHGSGRCLLGRPLLTEQEKFVFLMHIQQQIIFAAMRAVDAVCVCQIVVTAAVEDVYKRQARYSVKQCILAKIPR